MQTEPIKADPPKRKRRRFQFGLRTLMLVVALLAVALAFAGWHARRVRERTGFIARLQDSGAAIIPPGSRVVLHNINNWEIHADDAERPWLRRLLSDHYVKLALAPVGATRAELEQFQAVFPEAKVEQFSVKKPVSDPQSIRVGMTRDEVQQILGQAPESKSVDTAALNPESHSKAEIDAWNKTTIQSIDTYPSIRVKYNIEHRVLAVEQR